jgi:putative endonuclease
MYHVYVLYSEKYDRLYIGQTNNLENRIKRHNSGYEAATKPYVPWILITAFEFETREESVKMEKHWKQSNNRRKLRQLVIDKK